MVVVLRPRRQKLHHHTSRAFVCAIESDPRESQKRQQDRKNLQGPGSDGILRSESTVSSDVKLRTVTRHQRRPASSAGADCSSTQLVVSDCSQSGERTMTKIPAV